MFRDSLAALSGSDSPVLGGSGAGAGSGTTASGGLSNVLVEHFSFRSEIMKNWLIHFSHSNGGFTDPIGQNGFTPVPVSGSKDCAM